MKESPPRSVIRGCAWLDLAVTAPLAVPGVAGALLGALAALDALLGGAGSLPAFSPLHWMFVHLAGALGVVWALARLQLPDPRLARIDAIARIFVAGLIIWAIAGGAPRVFGLFVVTELAGSAVQLVVRNRTEPDAASVASPSR